MRRTQTIALIAVGLAALGVGGAWRAMSVRNALFERVERRLEAGAGGTVAAVERWIEERRYDAATAADEADHIAADLATRSPAARQQAIASLQHVLHRLRIGHGYMNAWALDSAGALIAAAIAGEPSRAERAAARLAFTSRAPQLCEPFVAEQDRVALCYAVAARDAGGLHDAGDRPIVSGSGIVIVLRSDPFGSLTPLVEASDVASETERTQLVARVGDSLAIIAGARPAAPGTHHSIGKLAWAAAPPLLQAAIRGTPVHGRHRALGGREMLGGARHVEGTQWAIVRRVDVAEILPAYRRQMLSELLLVAAVLAATALAVASARRAERSRRLREVAASETRLADTLRSSFDAVVAVDDAVRIQLFNAAAERLFRVPASAMLGQSITRIFPERLRPYHEERLLAFLDGPEGSRSVGGGGGAEYTAVRGDGEEFLFEAIISKGVADGSRLATIVLRDVSERRRAEEERERALSVLRATLEATGDGILVVDRSRQIVASNQRFLEIMGLENGLLSRDAVDDALQWATLAAVRDPEGFRARIAEIYAEPTAESYDIVELANGRLIERDSKPQRIGERLVGRVWSFRDITERERATAALRQAEKLAAVGQLVSGVAHELNNPLAAVLLFTEQMLEDERTPDDLETLTLVRDQARRARAIVRDLLAFVRNSSGEPTTVDARELLEQAARALDRQIAVEGGRVALHATGDIGAVRVDRAAIEQVLTNLVVNAVQAAPGRPVRIVAQAERGTVGRGTLVVAVEDEGPGIPAEVLPRVFEPFFTTKPVGVGTGLGLPVSLGIAERHGGTLRAENRAEGGARVVLTLPLTAPVAGHAAAPPAALPVAPATRRRVLLVDDEAPVRRALRAYFERRDWDVEEAEHGGPALERLLGDDRGAPIDLVISDLRMPGVGGAALHDRLASARPELLARLVIATGDMVSAEAAAFVARTRCTILEKPFEPSALDAMLTAMVADLGHVAESAVLTRV